MLKERPPTEVKVALLCQGLWGGGEGAGKRMSSPTPRVGKSLQYLSDRLLSCRERVAGRQ